jgi:hypothetical protein
MGEKLEIAMNVVHPSRGENGATSMGPDTDSHSSKHRAIVDTDRHPITPKRSDQEIINRFPVGYYPLHPNVSLNFQMNRFWNWVGDKQMLDELRAAGKRIKNYDDWAREMFDLSNTALAVGRRLPAAYYAKMAIFFLDPSDPRVKPSFQRFLDNVLGVNGVTPDDHHMVPYQQTHLSAYRFTPAEPRGTIVVFGGYDSYILEWLPAALALRDAGL